MATSSLGLQTVGVCFSPHPKGKDTLRTGVSECELCTGAGRAGPVRVVDTMDPKASEEPAAYAHPTIFYAVGSVYSDPWGT